MTDSAVSIIADTLRTHQFRLGKRDSFPVVFFAACSGCDWSTVALGEEGWSEHADHVAAAVVDALGGLQREVSQATRQCSYPGSDGPCVGKHHGRWVSGWLPEDAQ